MNFYRKGGKTKHGRTRESMLPNPPKVLVLAGSLHPLSTRLVYNVHGNYVRTNNQVDAVLSAAVPFVVAAVIHAQRMGD